MEIDARTDRNTSNGRSAVIDRILTVTGEEAQRVGPDRIRMGEVAARAGVSRASLYRYFANKDELIQAYTMREFDFLFAGIDEAMAPHEDFDARIGAAFAYALPALREHPVFVAVLGLAERQILRVTLQSGEVLGHARDLVVERMNRAVREGRIRIDQFDAAIAGELMARLVISLLATPESIARLDTGDDANDFALRYVLPLIDGISSRGA
ncbi:MAG: TetR/AcrR family transcriptional regulator [Actinobacteria bacterium]|nr:TetR/AcrR family transcriptional regulator [Actinomycetota bacterium]